MSVVDIFNVPTTPEELQRWSFLHMALHRSENLAVFRRFNILLVENILDPIDLQPNSGWFYDHQVMHNNMDQILGIEQFNLLDVDWDDPGQRLGWLQSHAQLHKQETDKLETFA